MLSSISQVRKGSSGEMMCLEETKTDANLLCSLGGVQCSLTEPSSLQGGLSRSLATTTGPAPHFSEALNSSTESLYKSPTAGMGEQMPEV